MKAGEDVLRCIMASDPGDRERFERDARLPRASDRKFMDRGGA